MHTYISVHAHQHVPLYNACAYIHINMYVYTYIHMNMYVYTEEADGVAAELPPKEEEETFTSLLDIIAAVRKVGVSVLKPVEKEPGMCVYLY